MDLYIQAMPVGTYRVQSPGFPKIVYYYAQLRKAAVRYWAVDADVTAHRRRGKSCPTFSLERLEGGQIIALHA